MTVLEDRGDLLPIYFRCQTQEREKKKKKTGMEMWRRFSHREDDIHENNEDSEKTAGVLKRFNVSDIIHKLLLFMRTLLD